MSDSKGIAQEAIADLSQTGAQVVKEAASVVTSMPGSIMQQIAGTTPTGLAEAKARQAQKDAAQIQMTQAQLTQHIQAKRQAREQMQQNHELKQQQVAQPRFGLDTPSSSGNMNVGHKLAERRSDKRHG